MTVQRRDGNPPSEFSEWLRHQPEIDSKIGFVATNIDFMWMDYKRSLWMYLEEKRYNKQVSPYQLNMFKIVDSSTFSSYYKGFHIIRFEKTNPDDGKIWLDNEEITRDQLIDFLRFELHDKYYRSYFEKTESRSVQHKK